MPRHDPPVTIDPVKWQALSNAHIAMRASCTDQEQRDWVAQKANSWHDCMDRIEANFLAGVPSPVRQQPILDGTAGLRGSAAIKPSIYTMKQINSTGLQSRGGEPA